MQGQQGKSITSMAGPVQMPEAYPFGIKTITPGNTVVEALALLGPRFEEVPLPGPSAYIKPKAVLYDFNGKQRRWDVVESHASVGVVLYHRDLQAWLLVRQFRPPVYASRLRAAKAAGLPAPGFLSGFTYELCAGLIDKSGKSVAEICKEEIMEECGFDVPLESISEIATAHSAIGTQGAEHVVFYAEVDASMQREAGGGLLSHGECIEVLALPVEHTQAFVVDNSLPKSAGLMFGLIWSLNKLQAAGRLPSNGLMTQELTLQPVVPA